MRVDSIGLYNNKGLIQNKNNHAGLRKTGNAEQNVSANKAGFPQKMVIPKSSEALSELSIAELSQIKKLFGQFDVAALSELNKRSLDEGPGQFIDIVV